MLSLLDSRTLAITMGGLSLTLAVCTALALREKRGQEELRYYALALFCLFVGQVLVGARGYVHDVFSVVLGNAALLAYFSLTYDGVAVLLDRKAPRWHYLMSAFSVAGPLAYFTFVTPSVGARVVIFSAVSLVYCGAFLRLLFGEVRRRHGPSWALVFALVCGVAVSAVRLTEALVAEAPLPDLLEGGSLERVTFILQMPMLVGTVLGLIGLTFQKTARARRESEAFSRSIFEAAPDAILVSDATGRYLEANPAACALYRCSRERLLDMSVTDLGWRPYPKELAEKGRYPAEGYVEEARRAHDGTEIMVELAYAHVPFFGKPAVMSIARDVTPRLSAEQALRSSEQRHRSLVAAVSDIIWEVDVDGMVRYVSLKVKEVLGYDPDGAIGRSIFELMSERDAARLRIELRKHVAERSTFAGLVGKARSKDGRELVLEHSGVPSLGPDGALAAYWVCTKDVTARARAEEAIRYLAGLLDRVSDAIISTDAELRIVSWNRAAEDIYGWSEGEVLGKGTAEVFSTDYRPATRAQMLEALEASGSWAGEVIQRNRSGAPIGIQMNVTALRDGAGRLSGVVGVHRDVSAQKRAAQALRESEERLRTIFEASMAGITLMDADDTIVFANQRVADMFGCPLATLIGSQLYDFVHPEDRVESRRTRDSLLAGATESDSAERRFVRADGSEFWALVSSRRFTDAGGRITYVISNITDFTELRNAREALEQSEEHHRSIFVNAPIGIVRSTVAGKLIGANPAFSRMLGYESPADLSAAMEGRRMEEVIYENAADRPGFVRRVLEEGGWQSYDELHMRRKDGTIAITNLSTHVHLSANGAENELESFVEDITERKRAEEERERLQAQFRQAQKMEAIGRLAGGVAHDFNNLLTVILGYCEIAANDLRAEDPLREYLEGIDGAARRATGLTSQLLAFSRKQVLQPRLIDMDELVAGMAKMLRRLLGEDVELRVLGTPDIWRANADPGKIEQVVMNLAVNARDAMPDGGILTLETANTRLDAAYAQAHMEATEGEFVLLAVSDTGQGMDAATMARVFEPFFTTKEVGKGTGLGLATVYGIVKQSGGHIGCYSEPGRGTTFKVYLPRAREEAPAVGLQAGPEAAPARGSETIILVEDDDMVRALTDLLLRNAGYTILAARNGPEALLLLGTPGIQPALLVTDVVMPGMDGSRVAREVAERFPKIAVLYLSGYTEDTIVHRGVLEKGVQFLPKPFTAEELLGKVRALLDGRTGS